MQIPSQQKQFFIFSHIFHLEKVAFIWGFSNERLLVSKVDSTFFSALHLNPDPLKWRYAKRFCNYYLFETGELFSAQNTHVVGSCGWLGGGSWYYTLGGKKNHPQRASLDTASGIHLPFFSRVRWSFGRIPVCLTFIHVCFWKGMPGFGFTGARLKRKFVEEVT